MKLLAMRVTWLVGTLLAGLIAAAPMELGDMNFWLKGTQSMEDALKGLSRPEESFTEHAAHNFEGQHVHPGQSSSGYGLTYLQTHPYAAQHQPAYPYQGPPHIGLANHYGYTPEFQGRQPQFEGSSSSVARLPSTHGVPSFQSPVNVLAGVEYVPTARADRARALIENFRFPQTSYLSKSRKDRRKLRPSYKSAEGSSEVRVLHDSSVLERIVHVEQQPIYFALNKDLVRIEPQVVQSLKIRPMFGTPEGEAYFIADAAAVKHHFPQTQPSFGNYFKDGDIAFIKKARVPSGGQKQFDWAVVGRLRPEVLSDPGWWK